VDLGVPSVTKAREILAFETKVDLDKGISRTADHYRNQLQTCSRACASLEPPRHSALSECGGKLIMGEFLGENG